MGILNDNRQLTYNFNIRLVLDRNSDRLRVDVRIKRSEPEAYYFVSYRFNAGNFEILQNSNATVKHNGDQNIEMQLDDYKEMFPIQMRVTNEGTGRFNIVVYDTSAKYGNIKS